MSPSPATRLGEVADWKFENILFMSQKFMRNFDYKSYANMSVYAGVGLQFAESFRSETFPNLPPFPSNFAFVRTISE
jgi:hypothetical protein